MTEEEFRKKKVIVDKLSVIDEKFKEAHELFKKIYDEFIESDTFLLRIEWVNKDIKEGTSLKDFEAWQRERDRVYNSLEYQKYKMKMDLLREYLGIKDFPKDWYYHETWQEDTTMTLSKKYNS